MTLNLRKLLSISAQLSFEACTIIRKNLEQHSYKKYMKGEDDPVTDVIHFPSRLTTKSRP